MRKRWKDIFFFLILFFLYTGVAHSELNFTNIKIDFQKKASIEEPVKVEVSKEIKSKDTLLITLTLKMNKNIHVYASESLSFKIFTDSVRGVEKPIVVLPKPIIFKNFDKSEVPVFIDGQNIVLKCEIKDFDWEINGKLNFQACDTTMCFTPVSMRFKVTASGILSVTKDTTLALVKEESKEDIFKLLDKFTVVGMRGGYLKKASFLEFLKNPSQKDKDDFTDKNIFLIILLVLLGGIALNFTPCVLPIIPITLTIIGAGVKAKNRVEGFVSGTLYGLSMAVTYGILGAIVIISGTQFGVINSSPVFNIAIGIIFFIMSLALFDIFQIDFSRFRTPTSIAEKSKYLGIFIMGVITSLLAGACVAPVVISVVLYAGVLYAKGNFFALFLPFLLGLGLALPWPIAGAGVAFLPKPGKWMVWLKKFFGVVILILAVYYGYSGITSYLSRHSQDKKINISNEKEEIKWFSSLSDALKIALKEEKPLFIDFWATWCKNCKAMDVTTFKDSEVKKVLRNYVCVKYQAENPKEEATAKILNYFKIVGLPSYVVLEKRRD